MMTHTTCFQGLDLEVDHALLPEFDDVAPSVWQERTLVNLTEVSNLLDCLESDRKSVV